MNKYNLKKEASLQNKIILAVTIMLVVVIAALTFINVRYINQSTENALKKSMSETANVATAQISYAMSAKRSLVSATASRISTLYPTETAGDYDPDVAKAFEKTLAAMCNAYDFLDITVIDSSGFSRDTAHTDIATLQPDYYTKIVSKSNTVYTSDVIYDDDGNYIIYISVPLTDANGKAVGVIVCTIDASFLSELVSDISVGSNGSTFILNKTGGCIAHRNKDMLFKESEYKRIVGDTYYESLNTLFNTMISSSNGFYNYNFGGERLASYKTIDGENGWVLAVTAERSEFFEDVNEVIFTTIIISAIIMSASVFVMMAYTRSFSRRIAGITDRIERLAQGDLTTPVKDDKSLDEIGRLSTATKKLITELHSIIENINYVLSEISEGNLNVAAEGEYEGDFGEIRVTLDKNIEQLNEVIRKIAYSSCEVAGGSSKMAEGAAALAEGAADQANSMDELFKTVKALSEKALVVSNPYSDADELYSTAENGDIDERDLKVSLTLCDKLIISMQSMSDCLSEIKKISSAIENLSMETGMLALNASVEASHAGESGKGFAVIAAEIKNLSEKSRVEARNADTQIERIMKAVDGSNKSVENTVNSVNEMTDSLGKLRVSLEQISSIIENTAVTAEETARNSESLYSQAELLSDLVLEFNYKDENGKEVNV